MKASSVLRNLWSKLILKIKKKIEREIRNLEGNQQKKKYLERRENTAYSFLSIMICIFFYLTYKNCLQLYIQINICKHYAKKYNTESLWGMHFLFCRCMKWPLYIQSMRSVALLRQIGLWEWGHQLESIIKHKQLQNAEVIEYPFMWRTVHYTILCTETHMCTQILYRYVAMWVSVWFIIHKLIHYVRNAM